MNVKKLNKFFGYALFTVGALKLLLMILILIQLTSTISAIFSGAQVSTDDYTVFSGAIGFAQIILAICSIIMIIVNIKKQSGVVAGYLWGLGAILFELITPSLMIFFLIEIGIYLKAGTKIINKNQKWNPSSQNNKKMIKNTEWFFDDTKKESGINKFKEKIDKLTGIFNLEEINEEEYEDNYTMKNFRIFKDGYSYSIISFFIILVFVILGVFVYKFNKDDENNSENIVEQEQISSTEKNTNKKENVSNSANENKSQENINNSVNEEDSIHTQIIDQRLTEIANIFNSCDITKEMRAHGFMQSAMAIKDGIEIRSGNSHINCNINLKLENDILFAEILDDEDEYVRLTKANLVIILVDCMGQIKGYPENAIIDVLWDESSSNYTLENEGIEIKRLENDQGGVIRVDLNSDFPFMK